MQRHTRTLVFDRPRPRPARRDREGNLVVRHRDRRGVYPQPIRAPYAGRTDVVRHGSRCRGATRRCETGAARRRDTNTDHAAMPRCSRRVGVQSTGRPLNGRPVGADLGPDRTASRRSTNMPHPARSNQHNSHCPESTKRIGRARSGDRRAPRCDVAQALAGACRIAISSLIL